jgi:hypothetical protein
MRRVTTYPGAIPLEVDILNSQKNTMIAIGHVLQDMIGTSTLFSGLGCVPTAPAGMTVNVNPGRAYSLQATDSGAYSSLSADATQLVKQGILLTAQNFSCPAPTTAGFSINYLVQGAFQEVDGGSTVLPYYNASNPAQAYSGPNGTGASNNTYRDDTVQLSLKVGVATTTGSQITPTPDAGFTGLWVITVPYGATTITSGNISQYSGAPFLTSSLLSMIQQNGLYAVATGTANAHVAAFSPALTTRTDGMVLRYKAPAANTGALTLNDGLGAVAVVGAAHSALQGGETAANGDVWVQWNSSIGGGSYVLIDSTGGAVQVAPATQSQHAMQFGQATGRLLNVQVFNGSGTYTPTAGMKTAIVEVQGAGGGSGGAPATSAGQFSGSSGASSGTYAKCLLTAAQIGASQAVTIGAAGTAGAAGFSSGGTGGTSSLGSLIACTGGPGSQSYGPSGATLVISNAPTVSATVPTTTGTVIQVTQGSFGNAAIGATSGGVLSGPGGSSPMTGANTGVGAGAPGSVLNASSAATAGAAGGAGKIVIWEFA